MSGIDLSHFLIAGPTVVGNSGGKTSGFNLHLHLQANGGTLTGAGRCSFTNTGWEDSLTLDFLCEQSRRWGVPIHWLEFCRRPATPAELDRLECKWQKAQDRLARFNSEPPSFFARKRRKAAALLFAPEPEELKREAVRKAGVYALACFQSWRKAELIGVDAFRRVDRATASLGGEPYEELLAGLLRFRREVKGEPGVLPNGVQRICTGHLKVRVTSRFAAEEWPALGKNDFECRLGLRSDEEERVRAARQWDSDGGRAVFPLYEAGVEKADVAAFWKAQPFTLALKGYAGNCRGCHMKRRAALVSLIREGMDVSWWRGWEERTGQRFRAERTYRGLEVAARTERSLPMMDDDLDNAITCETGYCSN